MTRITNIFKLLTLSNAGMKLEKYENLPNPGCQKFYDERQMRICRISLTELLYT